jgi:hypothetical protein
MLRLLKAAGGLALISIAMSAIAIEACNRGRETFLVASVVQMHASKSWMLSVPWYLNGHWEARSGRCAEV